MLWSWADGIIIAILAISILISLIRGFLREALSLITWIMAGVLSLYLADPLSQVFSASIKHPLLRLMLSYGLIFMTVLIIGSIFNAILSKLVKKTGLTSTDRMLGMLFGAARGILIVVVLIMLAQLAKFNEQNWWLEAKLIQPFLPLESWLQHHAEKQLKHYLPTDWQQDEDGKLSLPIPFKPGKFEKLPYQPEDSYTLPER